MAIKTLLVDVGGVLLTNGWDTAMRKKAAQHFSIDPLEMQQRHDMIFEDFECGHCSFDEYLNHIVFFKQRPFTLEAFKEYVYAQSKPYPRTIERVKAIKKRHHAKLAVLSNEGREIAINRFLKFNFHEFVDYFIVSSFVGCRKPDLRIYKLALDLSQEDPRHVLYIDDRPHYFDAARSLGLRPVCVNSELVSTETRRPVKE